jgi:hypothetical protein
MAKFLVVLELEISLERESEFKKENMSEAENEYIEREIQWLNQSFDYVYVARIWKVNEGDKQ